MATHIDTNKPSHKSLTYTQQAVNICTKEHVYRYATLLLGVCVCLGHVSRKTKATLRVPVVGSHVSGGLQSS